MVTSRTRRGRPARGFTLLELLVVLAIAGMLVALVPPVISAVVPGTRAKSAALELAATLRDARNTAITQSTPIDVEFDVEAATYEVAGTDVRELPRDLQLTILEAGTAKRARLQRDDDGRQVYVLRFHADGSSNGLEALLGRESKGYSVHVDWLMGGVTIVSAAAEAAGGGR